MTDRRRATAWLMLASSTLLWGCPPNLTGEGCSNDCNCPTSQTCVQASDNGNSAPGTCQTGVNTCDAGVSTDGGQFQFAGNVVLNGGITPLNSVEIYGYADGTPDFDGGNYVSADLMQLSSNGAFAFSGSVPPATSIGYRFAAVYDTNRGTDFDFDHPGVFAEESATMLAPDSDAGLSMRIDVQTSTCFSITTELEPAGITILFAAGIVAYDIRTGGPLTQPTDFDSAFAVFDAGSAIPSVPDAGSPFGQLTLIPVGPVPETEITNSWLYAPPGLTAISNDGSFFFSFTDGTSGKPEYPAGSCVVAYSPPPGFPSSLTVNGMDGGPAWGGIASSGKGQDIVAWQDDAKSLPAGITFLGDLVTIDDSSGTQLYPSTGGAQPQLNLSPLTIKDGTVPIGSCDELAKKTCTLNVTSLYEDARKPRSTPYEGGTTVLNFQRSPGTMPPPED